MKKSILIASGLLLTCSSLFAQERALGMEFTEKDNEVPIIDKPLGFGENLPKKVSLVDFVPNIGDQENHGTCVGWSSTYTIATMEWAILNNEKDKSIITANVYDPYHTYLSIINNANPDSYETCEGGTYISDACYQLYSNGAKRRFDGQVYCGNEITQAKDNSTVEFKDYYRLYSRFDDMEENVTAVCAALADNHPVLFGMYVPRSLFSIGSDGLLTPTSAERNDPIGTSAGGHAMAIVGYDDEKFGGCFTVVNSWGSSWGDDGYLYIKYEDYQRFTHTAYSFETSLKYTPTTSSVGCLYGDCNSGYGISVNKKGGVFEGQFSGTIPTNGVYVAKNKKGKGYMKKLVKKNGGYLIYDKYDYKQKKPIGCFIY